MIDRTTIRSNYSAEVDLQLFVGGSVLPLSKVGPDYVVLREGIELEPCDAETVITVDDRKHVFTVRLVDGSVPFDRLVRTEQR